jgi:hypothetical protein
MNRPVILEPKKTLYTERATPMWLIIKIYLPFPNSLAYTSVH